MNKQCGKIEAILLAVAKPIPHAQLAKVLEMSESDFRSAVDELRANLNQDSSGINLIEHDGRLSLATNPAFFDDIRKFAKDDLSGELTRPSLETLTIIAYRGPITKPEIEQIRGVNCSLIIRNLLIRDMIVEEMNNEKLQPVYQVSETFLRHLGLTSIDKLQSYDEFAHNEDIDNILKETENVEV